MTDSITSRKWLLAGFFVCFLVGAVLVWAIQSNWYETADLTGTIKKNEVSITKGQLNLGDITSGASFTGATTATVTIPVTQAGGQNISKFLLIVPVRLQSDSETYLQERFSSLSLNVTIAGVNQTLPIVVGNVFDWGSSPASSDWAHEDSESSPDRCWFSSHHWTRTALSTGSHSVKITAFGIASAPSVDLAIALSFAIELT
ncbi:MAG: hypothetical protein ACE5OZ_08180 [Candidatus Heimdallarchaeota archaeon]